MIADYSEEKAWAETQALHAEACAEYARAWATQLEADGSDKSARRAEDLRWTALQYLDAAQTLRRQVRDA